ncbi:MAG: hypothetical protein JW789_00315 [Candidatus Aenigmarchaeota archaeon]|nr:hypothetical protein [Candidatus Aenigmarchaeota archaeon]
MGRAANYGADRGKLKAWADQERRVLNNENVIIKDGSGRYPECFEILPYGWCPKLEEIPEDPKDVPKTCKACQEFLKSKFYEKYFMLDNYRKKLERMKSLGLPTMIVNERKRD